MPLVPIIQLQIMRALISEKEWAIEMVQLREVSQLERVIFPLLLLLLAAFLFLPSVFAFPNYTN